MKDFIKYICYVLGPVFIYCLMNLYILTHPHIDRVKTETVIFGLSTGACSINDFILTDYTNLCVFGIPIWYQQEYISSIINHNPHIKRVILCFDPVTYNDYSDKLNNHWPDSFYSSIRHCARSSGYGLFIKYSIHHICNFVFYINNFYKVEPHIHGFKDLGKRNILPYINHIENKHDYYDIPYSITEKTHSMEQQALRNIIALCQSKNITTVVYQAPMYQLKRWYGRKGYEDFLSTLPSSILVSEYTDFKFPSDEYYRDARHLNGKGAEYLSKHIKDQGLKMELLEEYLARKKRERGDE